MGCVCCSLSSFVSIVLDALERVTLCTVCAMLSCCVMFTVIIVSVMGVGIGYHYCFVQHTVESMAQAAKAASSLRSGPEQGSVMRSLGKAYQRGFAHRLSRRETEDNPPSTNLRLDSTNGTDLLRANSTVLNVTDIIPNIIPVWNITNVTAIFNFTAY